jgi:hypothetical protein
MFRGTAPATDFSARPLFQSAHLAILRGVLFHAISGLAGGAPIFNPGFKKEVQ